MSAFPPLATGLILAVVGAAVVVSHASAQTPTATERSKQIKIKIGSKTFDATLEDNATADAFKALLPMTVNMSELNGNEKLYRLPAQSADKRIQPPNDPERRFDALWVENGGAFLQELSDLIRIHPVGAGPGYDGTCRGGWLGKRNGHFFG